ncbi:MAG: endonuclease/exonuclease/phosphatase family protein [Planctomyces sp.]|nr:endonuclease/exonuclease/phosphatase family protein [Planctomyces sp.]
MSVPMLPAAGEKPPPGFLLPPPRPWRRRLLTAARAAALLLLAAGLIVRSTVQDSLPGTGVIYYATPWSVLAIVALLAAKFAQLRSRRLECRLLFATSLGCALAWHSSSWQIRDPGTAQTEVRVATWNVAHGSLGLRELVEHLATMRPDIAVLVEADPADEDVRGICKAAFPEHHVSILGAGLVLISRWPAGEAKAYRLGSPKVDSRLRELDVETPWGPWTIFAVDLGSDPLYFRRPTFELLAEHLDRRRGQPMIVAGDFNTPLDSTNFRMLRTRGLRELFLSSGNGYTPTWPVPAPVLSLDQIWVSETLSPVRCERHWHWRSDHAAVVGVISPL